MSTELFDPGLSCYFFGMIDRLREFPESETMNPPTWM